MFWRSGKIAREREERLRQESLIPARNMRRELFAANGGTYPLSDPLAFDNLFGPERPRISPDLAMAHSAFYRCVFLIAGSIAMLRFKTYKVSPDGRRESDDTSPASKLIAVRPNGRMSCTMLWRQIAADMLTSGNGIAYIERNRDGTPLNLYPVPWSRTGIRLDNISGDQIQVYTLTLDNGRFVIAHQDDVLHIPGSAVWQIFRAMSPLTAYAMAAGIGLSADAFAKAYFDNGSSPDGYIKYPAGLAKGTDQADEIRTYWHKKFGGVSRFSGPAVLTEGGEFVPLAINAADAQLLEARRFAVADIGRVFGVPPHMLGETDKATSFGKGLEELTQSFVDFTLGPHLRAIEDEVNYKLVRQSTKIAEFDREGFIRGDLKSRMESFQIALGGAQGPGILTPNEVRQKMNLGTSDDPAADKLVNWPGGPKAASPDAASAGAPGKDAPPREEPVQGDEPAPPQQKARKARPSPPRAPRKTASPNHKQVLYTGLAQSQEQVRYTGLAQSQDQAK